MLGLFSSPRKRRAPYGRRSVRPELEWLETRDCPSTLSMSVTYGAQRSITLSGQLTDTPSPGNQSILISGVASGTAVTDANGRYAITLTASGLGMVSGITADHQSNTAQVTLSDTAPNISNFVGKESAGDWWTFTGKVTYGQTLQGLTVNFGGQAVSLQGKTTTVDANGNFSFSIQLDGTENDNGLVSATITDWWGQRSNTALTNVYQT
jgi:hypothetical protein